MNYSLLNLLINLLTTHDIYTTLISGADISIYYSGSTDGTISCGRSVTHSMWTHSMWARLVVQTRCYMEMTKMNESFYWRPPTQLICCQNDLWRLHPKTGSGVSRVILILRPGTHRAARISSFFALALLEHLKWLHPYIFISNCHMHICTFAFVCVHIN